MRRRLRKYDRLTIYEAIIPQESVATLASMTLCKLRNRTGQVCFQTHSMTRVGAEKDHILSRNSGGRREKSGNVVLVGAGRGGGRRMGSQ